MSNDEFGVDRVERKHPLERADIYSKAEFDRAWRKKFREAPPAQVPNADRGCASPLLGLAVPANRGARK
jgi:hypothetical protein